MIKIVEPVVKVIGKTCFLQDKWVEFAVDYQLNPEKNTDYRMAGQSMWESSDPQLISEFAGRVCYWSFDNPRPGGNQAYLENILDSRHGSVLEHATWNFYIGGVSRSLTHELVRHRAGWAFSQLSQRYVDESDTAFVRPMEVPDDSRDIAYDTWKLSCANALANYVSIVTSLEEKFKSDGGSKTELRKRVRQTARSVLPNCTETRLLATANARAIRHFLEQRGGLGAEPEIRRLAGMVLDIVKVDSPNIFGDYETADLPDGTRHIFTKYGKV